VLSKWDGVTYRLFQDNSLRPGNASVYGGSAQELVIDYFRSGDITADVGRAEMYTEARGVFIYGLSYKANANDVHEVLSQVAIPIHIKLHMDWRSGQSRGSAIAEFACEGDAATVVETLNGVRHMGRKIGVRFDTVPTVVGYIQRPVIDNQLHYKNRTTYHLQ
jgi:RNA recognition motif-containing protein